VYDALVRMVQNFSLRYPLIAGQGNFGSVDGDSAAAYRYTEARLAPIATEMLSDIDKETVDFAPNFDDRLLEPTVLPAKIPNLLVNGSSGIAVGMSTNIPPHNLREVVGAAIHLLDHPECSIADLMRYIPGPDFPTGGIIVGKKGIRDAYEKGRGRVVMRARVVREQKRAGREQLVVTEIPYATSKTRILEQIVDLVKRGKIDDISDLRDESDRDGIRIVIELKRGADAVAVLGRLFKWTSLQATFGVISLALDGGVPHEFSLKEILERFRDHRVHVVIRRSQWELGKARDEAHVLEGLLIALKRIDEVIRLIRGSRNRGTASKKLEKQFKLTERQAEAILNMRLVKLTALEKKELQDRMAVLKARIAELEAILASPEQQLAVVRSEVEALLEAYGDERRTRIVEEDDFVLEDLTADEEMVVIVSAQGFVKAIPMAVYRRRGGADQALAAMERYEGDYLRHGFATTTGDTLLFFTDDGRAYALAAAEVPEGGRTARGRALYQILGFARASRVVAVLSLARAPAEGMLVFVTRDGTVKRTPLDQFTGLRAGGVNAINLQTGDRLLDAQFSNGAGEILLATRKGRVIRFEEEEVSPMGRAAQGVRGIRLTSGDRVVSFLATRRETTLCTVTEKGFAKRTPLAEFAVQRRGGLGVVATPLDRTTGAVAVVSEIADGDQIALISNSGRICSLAGDQLPMEAPGAPGAPLIDVPAGEMLLDLTLAPSRSVTGDTEQPAEDEYDPDSPLDPDDLVAPAGDAEETDETQYNLLGADKE
nr:DNA gyrase subunit A [Gemmatimonadota bacterium]